jgi:integrase
VIQIDAVHAKTPQRLPTVLTKEEAQRVLAAMSGTYQLIAEYLYGSGLRLAAQSTSPTLSNASIPTPIRFLPRNSAL